MSIASRHLQLLEGDDDRLHKEQVLSGVLGAMYAGPLQLSLVYPLMSLNAPFQLVLTR